MPFPKTMQDMINQQYKFDDYAVCKGCGEDIEWWSTPRGKKIPMNPMESGSSEAISHFSTCTEAESFRGKHVN